MSNQRFRSEAAQRSAERMAREDAAPRLRDLVPELRTLKLEIAEYRQDGDEPLARYTKHVVVERAPALFRLVCGDSDCDGSHDLTGEIMRALRASRTGFEGDALCNGHLKASSCSRRLSFTAEATYGS